MIRRILLGIVLAAGFASAADAQSVTAKIVTACGLSSFPTGSNQPLQMNSDGILCTVGGGSGGGGGGTEYTEGQTDTTLTGPVVMMEDAGDTLRPLQGNVADGLFVKITNPGDISIDPTGLATDAKQDTIIGHVDGLETLIGTTNTTLATIDLNTDGIEAALTTIDGRVDGLETLAGATNTALGTVNSNLTTIIGHVDGIEGAIATGNASLASLVTQTDGIEASVDGIEALIGSTNTAIGTGNTTLTSILGAVDGVEALLGTIDADTGALAATDFMLGTDFSNVLGSASLITATQADNLLNTTDTLNASALNYVFDGSAWDRWTGAVTANAGTNLNTSALALESGGNLAAIVTRLGEVQTTPTANTVLSRLKAINDTLAGGLTVTTGGLTDTQLRASPVPVSGTVALGGGSASIGTLGANSGVDIGDVTINNTSIAVTDNAGSLTVDAPVGTPVFVRLSDGTNPISTLPISGTVDLGTLNGAATAANQTSVIGSKAPGTAAASALLAGGVYNSAGVTLTNGQQAALQMNASGEVLVDCPACAGGGGGVSADIGDPFPTTGQPVSPLGVQDSAGNVAPLELESDGSVPVTIVAGAGSGGTASTDDAAFTAGSGSGTPMMGFATSDTVNAGDVGVLAMTDTRALFVNLRDAAGAEITTLPISAAALPLPSGAATAANQTTANASLSAIETSVGLLDNAVAGSELQVDIVSAPTINVADGGGALTIDGSLTNISGTISLPTGAATAAKQPALGTAGSASADVITVQGIASMTPLVVADGGSTLSVDDGGSSITVDGTFWQNTQPVSVAAAVSTTPAGSIAHDSTATSVNPVLAGGYASAAAPASVSADGDAVRAWYLRNGAAATVLTAGGALIGGDASNGLDVDVTRMAALVASTANIGDVDVLTVPADPFGTNADAASASGSISAKLRQIATNGIPITGTVTVGSHAVTNAGTFVVQENGAALTALQLIDNIVAVDDAAFTPATGSLAMAGFTFDDVTPDSVNEGDAGAARMSANRNVYVTIRDAAGNERGLNVTAGGAILTDGSATTQPVSIAAAVGVTDNAGSLTVDAPVGTPVFVRLSDGSSAISTLPVSLASLPALAAGTNNIGDVDVLTLPALPAGNNNIGDVDIASIAAGNNNIGDVDVASLPSVTIGTFPDNEPFNVAQINGVTPLMGAGNTGTGSPRVTIATDQAALAGMGVGATASAAPANAVYLGVGGDGGLAAGTPALVPVFGCTDTAIYDASTSGNTQLVALTSSETIYVCGFEIRTGATATNVRLVYGTGTACATGETSMTPVFDMTSYDGQVVMSPFYAGMKTAVSNALCIETSAANPVDAIVFYTKF